MFLSLMKKTVKSKHVMRVHWNFVMIPLKQFQSGHQISQLFVNVECSFDCRMEEFGMVCLCGTTISIRSLTVWKNVIFALPCCIPERISFRNFLARPARRNFILHVWYVVFLTTINAVEVIIYFFQYKWFSTSNKSTCPICRNLFQKYFGSFFF